MNIIQSFSHAFETTKPLAELSDRSADDFLKNAKYIETDSLERIIGVAAFDVREDKRTAANILLKRALCCMDTEHYKAQMPPVIERMILLIRHDRQNGPMTFNDSSNEGLNQLRLYDRLNLVRILSVIVSKAPFGMECPDPDPLVELFLRAQKEKERDKGSLIGNENKLDNLTLALQRQTIFALEQIQRQWPDAIKLPDIKRIDRHGESLRDFYIDGARNNLYVNAIYEEERAKNRLKGPPPFFRRTFYQPRHR